MRCLPAPRRRPSASRATVLSLALIVPVVTAAVAAGDDPGAANLPQVENGPAVELPELLQQLGDSSRAVRLRAERELLARGPAILSELPPPELLPTAAAREAVRRIRIELERQQAVMAAEASTVRLTDRLPLADVAAAISEQTGNRIDLSQLTDDQLQRPLRVELDEATFWDAVQAMTHAAGLRVADPADQPAASVLIVPGDDPAVAVQTAGPFRIAVTNAARRPLFGQDDREIVRVTFAILCEPRLRPLFAKLDLSKFAATLDGEPLRVFSPEARQELPFGERGNSVTVHVDFVAPAGRHARPQKLTFAGEPEVFLAAGRQPVVFENPQQNEGTLRRRGGVSVALQRARFEPRRNRLAADVRIAVSYDAGGPAFESHRTWVFHNEAWLESPAGLRVPFSPPLNTRLQTDAGVVVEYRFILPGDADGDWKFVYTAPVLLTDTTAAFRFTGVPLTEHAR